MRNLEPCSLRKGTVEIISIQLVNTSQLTKRHNPSPTTTQLLIIYIYIYTISSKLQHIFNMKGPSLWCHPINFQGWVWPFKKMTTILHTTSSIGLVCHLKYTERHCAPDPGSSFVLMTFLKLMPSRCCPSFADTWLVGPLMATGSATLNNGRLRHNHPQRGEDSLWPHHPFLSFAGLQRERERKAETQQERKKEDERKDRANYSVNPEAKKRQRERLRVRVVSPCLWCLTLVDSAKTANQRDVQPKASLWVATLQPPRLHNHSHMLMGCHLVLKSTGGWRL